MGWADVNRFVGYFGKQVGGPDVSDARRLCQLLWLADAWKSPRSWLVGTLQDTQHYYYLGYKDSITNFTNAGSDYL